MAPCFVTQWPVQLPCLSVDADACVWGCTVPLPASPFCLRVPVLWVGSISCPRFSWDICSCRSTVPVKSQAARSRVGALCVSCGFSLRPAGGHLDSLLGNPTRCQYLQVFSLEPIFLELFPLFSHLAKKDIHRAATAIAHPWEISKSVSMGQKPPRAQT